MNGAVETPRNDVAAAASWIADVKEALPAFLRRMRGRRRPGFYRYSWSGDRFGERPHWGLGNTAFAVKCWYTIGALETLEPEHRAAMVGFIRSFERRDGLVYDGFLRRRALGRDLAETVRGLRFRDPPWDQARRAETRQSCSALRLLGEPVTAPTFPYMRDAQTVRRFLEQLDWERPWSAGSHLSHLLFFLRHSAHPQKEDLIDRTVEQLALLQRGDGAWYEGAPDLRQRINGAMKVITALSVVGRTSFDRSRALIDTCLAASQDEHACDNFNIIYVLKYASLLAGGYRREEIRSFCLDRLEVYRRYYHPEIGGFSFWEDQANRVYYGARVSKGRDEPDLHGTTLFMWGLSIIAQLLGIDDELNLLEFDP
jgi:hypothetical protein